jgi:hypothetical protein
MYKTTTLPVALYRYETWCLILRNEHRLGVFYNRTLRRIFRPNREEVVGGCRKLYDEELFNLYASAIITVIKSNR